MTKYDLLFKLNLKKHTCEAWNKQKHTFPIYWFNNYGKY